MTVEMQVDEKLIEAFHLMFDHFPEAVQLTHKSKQIVALNEPCKAMGREAGMICAKHGPPEAHKGCLANKALQHHKAAWAKGPQAGSDGRPRWRFGCPLTATRISSSILAWDT